MHIANAEGDKVPLLRGNHFPKMTGVISEMHYFTEREVKRPGIKRENVREGGGRKAQQKEKQRQLERKIEVRERDLESK